MQVQHQLGLPRTGSLGTGIQKDTAISGIAVTATDPDGQTVTYSEVTSVLTSNANTPASTMNLTLTVQLV